MKKPLVILVPLLVTACSTGAKNADADAVEKSLMSRKADFQRCYEKEQVAPRKSGKVVTSFTIAAEGKVSQAKIQNTTLNQPKVEACILKTIQSTAFPAPTAGGNAHVTYPFQFNSN